MHGAQATKFVNVIPPAAIVDNASYTANVIDTLGYDYCVVNFHIGATDIAMAALKVQESDVKSNTTALTSGADVTGLVFGTSTDIAGSTSALPTSTADNTIVRCEIDLTKRKRYLLPVATAGDGAAGTYLSCTAELSRAEISPVTASERGCGQILRV
jgi:Tfp pilus assembly protein PilX